MHDLIHKHIMQILKQCFIIASSVGRQEKHPHPTVQKLLSLWLKPGSVSDRSKPRRKEKKQYVYVCMYIHICGAPHFLISSRQDCSNLFRKLKGADSTKQPSIIGF